MKKRFLPADRRAIEREWTQQGKHQLLALRARLRERGWESHVVPGALGWVSERWVLESSWRPLGFTLQAAILCAWDWSVYGGYSLLDVPDSVVVFPELPAHGWSETERPLAERRAPASLELSRMKSDGGTFLRALDGLRNGTAKRRRRC